MPTNVLCESPFCTCRRRVREIQCSAEGQVRRDEVKAKWRERYVRHVRPPVSVRQARRSADEPEPLPIGDFCCAASVRQR